MMSAVTGGNTKVTGSSMAMVAVGPRPGKTPIAVPRKTPDEAVKQVGGSRSRLQTPAEDGSSNSIGYLPRLLCLPLTA